MTDREWIDSLAAALGVAAPDQSTVEIREAVPAEGGHRDASRGRGG